MNYLDALFKNCPIGTNKIRRKDWDKDTWIEAGEHGQVKCRYYIAVSKTKRIERLPYQINIECLADDWEVYHE